MIIAWKLTLFVYFCNVEKDFLHKIDLDSLQKEVKKDLDEIANLVHLKNPKGIYKWSKDQFDYGTRPSFNAIVRLLEHGATVETLFGVDYAKTHPIKNPVPSEFLEGLNGAKDPESALNALVERKILEMKANGKI